MPRSSRWVSVLVLWCALIGGFITARVVMTSTAAESEYTSSVPTMGSLPTGTPVDGAMHDSRNAPKLSVDNPVYLPFVARGSRNAPPPPPPPNPPIPTITSASFYISSLGFDFESMGRVKGAADARTPGVQRSVVILAFGAPEKIIQPDGSEELGTVLPFTNIYASLDDIEGIVQSFAIGYADGVDGDSNSFVTIIAGTSNLDPNDEGFVTDEHGRQWAGMVEDLQDWLETNNLNAQIEVAGGSDMELVWSRPSTTIAWVDGYRQITRGRSGRFLYNFGDAAGCPPVGGDPAGGNCEPSDNVDWVWTSEQVWYISRGVGNAFPIPQIYNRDPNDNPVVHSNAEQWALLKLDAVNDNRVTLIILGTLTQRQRCDDLATTGDDQCSQEGTDNTSRQGWIEMYNELNAFPATRQNEIPFRTYIREPMDGRDY